MVVFCIVLLALFCIAFVKASIQIEYADKGFEADFKIGPFKKNLYPGKKKEKKPGRGKKEKRDEAETEKQKKGGNAAAFKQMLPEIRAALKKIRHKIVIDDFVIHITVASEDPYTAAMLYGEAYTGFGILMPVLDNIFTIKKRDLGASVNFSETESTVYMKAKGALRLWEIFLIAFGFGMALLKDGSFSKKRKVE